MPGETLESFAAGFDRLLALGPQEIQVGILKRLRGTPIVRHDAEWQMVYNPHPPYEILQNKLLDFAAMQRLRRFARYLGSVGNSGNFTECSPLIWSQTRAVGDGNMPAPLPPAHDGGMPAGTASPFWAFLRWSEWLYSRVGRTDGIALVRLMGLLFEYLTRELGRDPKEVAEVLWCDYRRGGRRDKPVFLKDYLGPEPEPPCRLGGQDLDIPKRQRRFGQSRSRPA